MRGRWLLFFLPFTAYQNNCAAQAVVDTTNFWRIYRTADSLVNADPPDFELALKKLEAAKLSAPALTDSANHLVVEIYRKVNGLLAKTKEALRQEGIALEESKRQQRISEAGRLAAVVEENCLVHPSAAIDNAQMAIQAIRMNPGFQSDRALRNVLSVFPPLETDLAIGLDPKVMAVDTAHRLLAIGGYAEGSTFKVCLIDIRTRRLKFTLAFAIQPTQVALSPDGRFLAVGLTNLVARKGVVEVRATDDTTNGYELPLTNYIGDLLFSPDSRYLVIGEWGRQIAVYKADKDSLIKTFPFIQHPGHSLGHLAFDGRGRYLVVNTDDSVQVWDEWEEPVPKPIFGCHGMAIRAAISKDGRWLGVQDLDSVQLYRLPDCALTGSRYIPELLRMQFVADNGLYTTQDVGGMVQLWNPAGESMVGSVNVGRNTLFDEELLFSGNSGNRYLFSAQDDEVSGASGVIAWDVKTRSVVARMFHDRPVHAALPLGDGSSALTIGTDRLVRWWGDIACCAMQMKSEKSFFNFWVSGDRRRLAAAAYSNGISRTGKMDVSLYDLADGHRTALLQQMPDDLATIFLPAGEVLLFTAGGTLRCPNRDGDSSSCRAEFILPAVSGNGWGSVGLAGLMGLIGLDVAAAVSSDGKVVAVCDSRGKVYIFRSPEWDHPEVIGYTNPAVNHRSELNVNRLTGVSVSRYGNLVSLGLTGTTVILDTRKGRQIAGLPTDYRTQGMQFTPDEKQLILATELHPPGGRKQAALLVYDLQATGSAPWTFPFDNDGVPGIAVGDDGRIAVYQGARTQVYALPAARDVRLVPLAEIENGKTVLRGLLSGDGKYLVTNSGDDIRFVVLRPEDLIAEALARMGADRVK